MNAETVVAQVTTLPTPSPVLLKLMTLLLQPEIDSSQIVPLVKSDGALCGKLLAACNSAAFGLSTPVGSVEQAIFYLGNQQVYRIVMVLGIGKQTGRSHPAHLIKEHDLWRHSLTTAVLAEIILTEGDVLKVDPSVAYTAGLLHDIGKLALNPFITAEWVAEIRRLITSEQLSPIEAERAVMETDHAEVGACLLRSWRIPELIVEAVASHHKPQLTPRPGLSAVVCVANRFAHRLDSASGEQASTPRSPDPIAAAVGLNPEKLDHVMSTAGSSLQNVERLVLIT